MMEQIVIKPEFRLMENRRPIDPPTREEELIISLEPPIEHAKRVYQVDLDLTLASLISVERILAKFCLSLPMTWREKMIYDEPRPEVTEWVMRMYGRYVGEILRRHPEGGWRIEDRLELGGSLTGICHDLGPDWPPREVLENINDGKISYQWRQALLMFRQARNTSRFEKIIPTPLPRAADQQFGMRDIEPGAEWDDMFKRYDYWGGVLDFSFFESVIEESREELHRAAALSGYAVKSTDLSKVKGSRISFEEFMGDDKPGEDFYVSGYWMPYFKPPYGFIEEPTRRAAIFNDMNQFIFGPEPEKAEIFSWSTDWSSFFDCGHEWWGAYLWTIRAAGSNRYVVIGASATD